MTTAHSTTRRSGYAANTVLAYEPTDAEKLKDVRYIYAYFTSWWGRLCLWLGCKQEIDSLIGLCHYLLDQQVTDDTNLSYADRCDHMADRLKWLTLCYKHKDKIPPRMTFGYLRRKKIEGSAQIFKEIEYLALKTLKYGVDLVMEKLNSFYELADGSYTMRNSAQPEFDSHMHGLMVACVAMQKAFKFEFVKEYLICIPRLVLFEKKIQAGSAEELYRQRKARYS